MVTEHKFFKLFVKLTLKLRFELEYYFSMQLWSLLLQLSYWNNFKVMQYQEVLINKLQQLFGLKTIDWNFINYTIAEWQTICKCYVYKITNTSPIYVPDYRVRRQVWHKIHIFGSFLIAPFCLWLCCRMYKYDFEVDVFVFSMVLTMKWKLQIINFDRTNIVWNQNEAIFLRL
jgi:hypothetical protein